MMKIEEQLRKAIREVPDFPKSGISFKDITPILEDPKLTQAVIDRFDELLSDKNIDAVIGVESRGFLFGMLLAQRLEVPFITVRKKGKLPYTTVSHKYELEYGVAEIEMHIDSLKKGWNVLIHDDLLATGGTAAATAKLVSDQECSIACFAFLIELSFLNGIDHLKKYSNNIISLVSY